MSSALLVRPATANRFNFRDHEVAMAQAKLALGRRMAETAIGPEEWIARIVRLQSILREGRSSTPVATRALLDRLLTELAEEALAYDAPLPGADEEYARVRMLEREHAASPVEAGSYS